MEVEGNASVFRFFDFGNEGFYLFQFVFGGPVVAKRLHDQVHGRAAENVVHKVVEQVLLGFGLRHSWFIDMAAVVGVAGEQALFLVHDLHDFQGGGIADLFPFAEFVVDEADGGGAVFPQYLQNLKLRLGGLWKYFIRHALIVCFK